VATTFIPSEKYETIIDVIGVVIIIIGIATFIINNCNIKNEKKEREKNASKFEALNYEAQRLRLITKGIPEHSISGPGKNPLFKQAYQEALKIYTLEKLPLDYAGAQNNLGVIWRALAEIQDKAHNCNMAIKAYQEALKVYVLGKFPIDYAMTQYNMGIVYYTLAKIQDKDYNYNIAIKAYKESIKVFTRKEFPEVYHRIEKNIKKCLL